MLEMSNISKIYQMGDESLYALQDVSLRVAEGEFVAIIGPSGSGKSTLMNLIGCLDVPSTGTYKLDGKDVSDLSGDQQAVIRNEKIGFIFQNFNLLTKLTALENVELPLLYRNTSSDERRRRALDALKQVGLSDRAGHKPMELSGGQQQRVAIARALAGDPPILLADEPIGNLDSTSGKEVTDLMHSLHRQGHTIILITHNQEQANEASRKVSLYDGRIISDQKVCHESDADTQAASASAPDGKRVSQ
ncbi:MAG: ABC transporter ATP-binding protein [Peptococcaceae bacterium]|jgi:putative ABC transport system ATP-binding protein|nr:ABC transporter ATP-binding protein [Peptococcaceae bacterium]